MNKSELLKELRIDRGAPTDGWSGLRLWIAIGAAAVFFVGLLVAFVAYGVVIASVIGMIGGFLPALRAARQPVTTALRAA